MRSSSMRTMEKIPALLRAHARTMALSLRILPPSLRDPLALAYLLARASDTIADSGNLAPEERIVALESLRAGEHSPQWIPVTLETLSPSERELLEALPDLLSILENHTDQKELATLWREILEGQLFDLRRFVPGATPLDQSERERYCDLVAGSVGRCWTRLIARHAPQYLLSPVGELMPLATAYGQGLQLVNILRDRESDRAIGREYVTEEEVPALLKVADEWLAAGECYLRSLRPGRILMASALPLDLAKATLQLVAAAPRGVRAKISCPAVWKAIILGARSLVLPRRPDPV